MSPYQGPRVKATKEERRKRVLELYHTDMSNTKIAKELGIDKNTVTKDMRFLSQQEGVEIVSRHSVKWKREKWIKAIDAIIKALPYFTSRGIKPSLRTIFYRLSSEGYIEKTERDYSNLIAHTVQARLGQIDNDGELSYPELPIDCFADETRRLIDNYSASSPVEPENEDDYIDQAIEDLKNAPGDYDGQGTKGGYWYNQPEYVEVWIEKFALAPTFESFLKDRYVNIVVNKGYSSLSFLWENCERLKEKIEEFDGAEHVHVLYFGDFDPSGEDMDRNIQEYFERFDVDPDIFERISLTLEQIQKYRIPLRPIKMTDVRANGFALEHGNKAAEIDGFFAIRPKVFEKMIQDAVDEYYDQSIYDEMEKKYKTSVPADELREIHHNMFYKITSAFTRRWAEEAAAEIEYDDEDDNDEDEDDDEDKEET